MPRQSPHVATAPMPILPATKPDLRKSPALLAFPQSAANRLIGFNQLTKFQPACYVLALGTRAQSATFSFKESHMKKAIIFAALMLFTIVSSGCNEYGIFWK
jgi:hypothetical protein